MPIVPIIGFAPDSEPTRQGVLLSVGNLIPTVRGTYSAAPSLTDLGIAALPAACLGIASLLALDNSSRIIAGTQTNLYELSGATWTDRSRAGVYATGGFKWMMAQFGNLALAANKSCTLQSSSGAAFADVATAPKASMIDAAQGFVMLADTNDGTYGDSPDRWWCSGIYDSTVWTPAVATQCTTGRLIDTTGPIQAMKALGSNFVAYKDSSIYLGQYVGAPIVWQWNLIPGNIGCPAKKGVVNIGNAHVFMGAEDFYLFDGSRPQPIGEGMRDWFFGSELLGSYRSSVEGIHDRTTGNVWFFYPSRNGGGALDAALVWNSRSSKWGRVSINIESAMEYQTPPISFDADSGTFDASALAFDDPSLASSARMPSVINAGHSLNSITGAALDSNLTTWDIGDDWQFSTLRRVRPRFISAPTTGILTEHFRSAPNGALRSDSPVSMSSTRQSFDLLRQARWHRMDMAFTGPVEIAALSIDLVAGGTE